MALAHTELEKLERALLSLEAAVAKSPENDLERDGAIQRFEFTFELAWKTMRRYLKSLGRVEVSGSPKPVLRDALAEGLINDLDAWFEFLEARNASTHIYNEAQARDVFLIAQRFPHFARGLLERLFQ